MLKLLMVLEGVSGFGVVMVSTLWMIRKLKAYHPYRREIKGWEVQEMALRVKAYMYHLVVGSILLVIFFIMFYALTS